MTTTDRLIRAVPRRACCASCARDRARWGADELDARGLATAAAATVQAAIDTVAALPATIADSVANATIGTARRQIVAAAAALASGAREAGTQGAQAVGDALAIMADRAATAAMELGRGAGEAFRAFWGLPPSVVFGLPLVLGGAAMLALALSPGGQGYSLAVGRGLGSALGSVGAGWGGAARDVARTLPALVRL
jgi:hypothetical protein